MTDTDVTFLSCYNIVGRTRMQVMTLTSPPSLPLSRPWAGLSIPILLAQARDRGTNKCKQKKHRTRGWAGRGFEHQLRTSFNMFDQAYQVEFKGRTYTVDHGSPFDRGSMDSYYSRIRNPHNHSRGFGWRIHCGVEVPELSTNKQHTLSKKYPNGLC